MSRTLVLGSRSPRRRELLASIGVPHEVQPADVAEPEPGTAPIDELARASALVKGTAVARARPGRLVLAADTLVALGDAPEQVLGKPADPAGARAMLLRLAGRDHLVVSAVALFREGPEGLRTACRLSRTSVTFHPMTPEFVERYVRTGEPLDKAGAYGAQGRAGTHVASICGSWSNVVGLPLETLSGLFEDMGETLEAWQDW